MTNVKCSECGLLNFASAVECKRCRKPLGADGGADEGAGWWRADAAAEGGAPRCGFCGYETTTEYCLRCKARVAQPAAEDAGRRAASRRGGSAGARRLKMFISLTLVVGAGLAGYFNRHRVWYGPHADLALVIRDSEQFQEPPAVAARRRVTVPSMAGAPMLKAAGPHADAVHVLEARGLVKFSTVSQEQRVVGTVKGPTRLTFAGEEAEEPEEYEVKESFDTAGAALTPEGRRQAEGWDESGDGWLVPIGSRRLYRIEEVGDVETDAAGVETREVAFTWRWVPEGVGEAFDIDGRLYESLPGAAQAAAGKLKWGSARAYHAAALLERAPGGEWRVKEIRASDAVNEKRGLSAF